jgi:mannose-1-phosphate guanylyltransferase/phosphomannomutase
MQAVVMAGGAGTRLRPLTTNRPKPMIPVVNRPILEHAVNLLKKNGVEDVVVTLQYFSSVIRNQFQDGSDYGVKTNYLIEEKPLGTAGGVKKAEQYLDKAFIVMSGDVLTDIDLYAEAADRIIEEYDEKIRDLIK